MAGREKYPYLDIKGFQGLFTKATQETLQAEQLRICQNVDFFEEYGSVAKIRGSSRTLTTPYLEGGVAKKITWLDFYKAPDLDGTILRHTLCAAGTTLGRVEDGKITQLAAGRTADLYHTADSIDRFMLITNQNPDRVGEGDAMVKYDGAVISNWGVRAPGDTETVVEEFDSAAAWTPYRCVVADQANSTAGQVTWDGAAVRVDHNFYTSRIFSIEKAHSGDGFYAQGDSRENQDAIVNRVNFFTYIPRGMLTASTTSPTNTGFRTTGPAISVYVSPDADSVTTNNWQFDFTNGAIFEGWNKLNLNFAAGAPGKGQLGGPSGTQVGAFYPEDQTIRRTRFEFYLANDNTVINGLVLDRYQKRDEGALVANVAGVGDITGVYSYKVIYVSKYGQLSNAGPASVGVTAADTLQIDLTKIPLSPDPQVTARRIYRTVGNGSVWLYLDEILDNVTTTYTDITADGSLGNETPPQAGDFSDDNAIPPQAGIVKVWKKTVFMAGDPQNPYTLYYSEDNEPESFPIINAFELDAKITAMYESYAGLVVETDTGKWQVIGDNPDFSLDKIVEGMGCVGRRAAGTARLIGYAVDRDGMRLFDLSETKKISEPIRDKYDSDIDKVNVELIHCVHSRSKNCIMQFNPDASGAYTSIFLYQYPIDAVETGYWTEISTPGAAGLNFLDAVEIEDSNGDFQVLVSGDDGMVYRIFDPSSKNWVDAAGVTYAIDTQLETPYIRGGPLGAEVELATGRVNPHSIELRTSTDDECVWTCVVSTAKGLDQVIPTDTSTISMQFGANNSLIRQRIPSSESTPEEYVKLKFSNAEKDVYTKISAARLYYHVNPGKFDVLDVDNTVV